MQFSRTSVLVAPVLILLLFSSALVGIDRLAFRDVSHFYTPLYDYVAWRCSTQWLPLWNPLDQTGMPLIGDTTTAVLYPIRYAVFALPIATETAIAWYVALHLILASVTVWFAARLSGISETAAAIAAVVYSLSGSVLFLYTNPPFLVGAAWLPLVLGIMLSRKPIDATRRAMIGGVAMAMMILGGDPQTALNAMILVAVVWTVRQVRRTDRNLPNKYVLSLRVVLGVPILAAVLTAPQIAASVSWSSHSHRIRDKSVEGRFDPPLVGGRRHETYQYSLAPWHSLELATPSAFGSTLPENRRLSRLIPGDGRTWTPSIYMGVLAAVCLLCRLACVRKWRVDFWLVTALMTLWLAMGHFGLVWFVQATTGSLSELDSAIGGPYWWLYQLVPAYDSFRYPAKWLTPFSLAVAMIVAQSIDRGVDQRVVRWIGIALGGSLLLGIATTFTLRWMPSLIAVADNGLPKDEFWGPLSIASGLSEIGLALLHSLVALVAVMLAFSRLREKRVALQLCLLAIVALDLSVSARHLIFTIPRQSEQQLLSQLPKPTPPPESRWMRTQTGDGWPNAWKQISDSERLVDVEASLRHAWFGRWHLADRIGVLNNMVSIRSHEIALFWIATREVTADMTAEQRLEFWKTVRHWLAIQGVTHTTESSDAVPASGRTAQMIQRIDRLDPPALRLRAHASWSHDPNPTTSVGAWVVRLSAMAKDSKPVVHSASDPILNPGTAESDAIINTVTEQPEHETHDVELSSATLLTRAVYQDGHWKARYAAANSSDWTSIPVQRVDYLKQGVILPAGQWRLEFDYQPWWLPWTMTLAAIGWMLAVSWLAVSWLGRRKIAG